jgi:hypothetical protein
MHARIRHGTETVEATELDSVHDLLARAVENQWTRAATDRGPPQPRPIAVRWQRPSLPTVTTYCGPIAQSAESARASNWLDTDAGRLRSLNTQVIRVGSRLGRAGLGGC